MRTVALLAVPKRSLEPLATRSFLLLVVGQFLQSLGFATLPLVPLFLAAMGAGREEIGTAMATGSIGGLLCRPAIGYALDHVGRRPVVLFGTVVLGLAVLSVGFTGGVGWLLTINRLVFGAGVAILFTSYFALVSDVIPESRRTEGIAIFGIAGILPLLVNPLAAIFEVDGAKLGVFFVVAGTMILLSLFVIARVPEPPARVDDGRSAERGLDALTSVLLRPVWVASLVFSALVAVFFAFSTVAATSHGVENATWLWFTYAGFAAGVRILGPRLPERIGPSNLIAPAVVFYAIAMVIVAGSSTTADVLLAGAFAGVAHGYAFPVITAQVVSRSPQRLRGSALSVYTAIWDVSALTFSPFAGRMSDRFGDQLMLTAAAMIASVLLVLWAVLEHAAARARSRTQTQGSQ